MRRKKRPRTVYSSKRDVKLVKRKLKPKARCLCRDNSLPLGLEFEYAPGGELY